jgi:hypothetical protein
MESSESDIVILVSLVAVEYDCCSRVMEEEEE